MQEWGNETTPRNLHAYVYALRPSRFGSCVKGGGEERLA